MHKTHFWCLFIYFFFFFSISFSLVWSSMCRVSVSSRNLSSFICYVNEARELRSQIVFNANLTFANGFAWSALSSIAHWVGAEFNLMKLRWCYASFCFLRFIVLFAFLSCYQGDVCGAVFLFGKCSFSSKIPLRQFSPIGCSY